MSLSNALLGIEQKMLDALEDNYAQWQQRGGPCPQSLFQQMRQVHEAITKRLKLELHTEETDPEKLLLMLELQRAHLLRLVAKKRNVSSEGG